MRTPYKMCMSTSGEHHGVVWWGLWLRVGAMCGVGGEGTVRICGVQGPYNMYGHKLEVSLWC